MVNVKNTFVARIEEEKYAFLSSNFANFAKKKKFGYFPVFLTPDRQTDTQKICDGESYSLNLSN